MMADNKPMISFVAEAKITVPATAATDTATFSSTLMPEVKVAERNTWAIEEMNYPEPAEQSSVYELLNLRSLKIDDQDDSDFEPAEQSSIYELPNLRSLKIDDQDDSKIEDMISCPYKSAKRFEDLNLTPELVKGLYVEMRFERPSKIQEDTLPMILTPPYKHLIAQAQNGSGKTTCFVLGMLSRVDPKLLAPQALCICPTRELAMQNMEVLLKMGKFTGITSVLAIPSDTANYIPPYRMPPVMKQVVIGTPGTIKKWVKAKKLGMSFMKILVFDEADHMLAEGGFRVDSIEIMKEIHKTSPDSQVLLFSATFNDDVKAFAEKIVKNIFVKDYNSMFMKKEELSLESVKQYKVYCPDELSKVMVIKDRLLELGDKVGQTIIFAKTRHSAAILHNSLVEIGYEVTTIQGALKQEDRDKIIKEFKQGYTQVLIATDLLSRGFDQSQVNLVVNYNLPVQYINPSEPDYEGYLHRVGRAGRFGRKGAVFNLCDDSEIQLMSKIANHFRSQIIEVPSWKSERDFEDALKKAGLL